MRSGEPAGNLIHLSRISAIAAGSCSGAKATACSRSCKYLISDSLVAVQPWPGMHHTVAHRVNRRPSLSKTASSHRSIGSTHSLGRAAQLLPVRVAKGKPSLAVPIPLISPLNRARGHDSQGAETASCLAGMRASKMENLIDDDRLLITRMWDPPPGQLVRCIHATPVVSLTGKFQRPACTSTHRVAELEKGVVRVGEAVEALARIFDLQGGIDRKGDRDCKRDAIEPAALGRQTSRTRRQTRSTR